MRLRKLILAGFKSFCDRTEFVFDDGVTCVVGPNGCGKSNVVDAVKWVLGEQSAKSLRGTEMMDVIFNGSSGRRSAGMAEVTLEFDNRSGVLQPGVPAASEKHPHAVSVTRRLYRSGESEYLINRQSARLRDIREMFMDTGIGRSAYSLIEQGRVAELLQTNPAERRVIFEEAAGISKYKARKREALRKLDRVEQNLLRVTDILAEVQKRLRSIKIQAGKARNYQRYVEQLNELRSLHGLARYHALRQQRIQLQQQLDELTDEATAISARVSQLDAGHASAEAEILELERQARQIEGEVASVGGEITTCEQRIEMLAQRQVELDEQAAAAESRRGQLNEQIAATRRQVSERTQRLQTVELELRQQAEQAEAVGAEHSRGQEALVALQAELADEKAGTIDLLRHTSQLHNEITAFDVRRQTLGNQKQRLAERADALAGQATAVITERTSFSGRLDEIREVIDEANARLETTKADTESASTRVGELDEQIAQFKQRRSSLDGRREMLDEMQRAGAGLGEGTKKVLAARREGRLGFVRGIVAEFVHARGAHAAVVEAALGAMEQWIVVGTLAELTRGRDELHEVLGGAGAEVLCLDQLPPLGQSDLSALPADCRRLMDLLEVDAEMAPALWRLLGRTFVVDDLSAAQAARRAAPAGCRFVTRDGAALPGDGSVRFGRASAAGLIARRGELADLTEQLQRVDAEIEGLIAQRSVAVQQRDHLEQVQQQLRTAVYESNTERVNAESRLERLDEQLAELQRDQPAVTRDIEAITAEIEQAARSTDVARQKVEQLEVRSAERQTRVESLEGGIAEATARLEHLGARLTELRVEQAQAQAARKSLQEAIESAGRAERRMEAEAHSVADEVEAARKRHSEAAEGITAARAKIEELFERKVQLDEQVADVARSREGLTERLEQIRAALSEQRKGLESSHRRANDVRVAVGEADVRIENLITQAADELGIELVEAYKSYEHDDTRDWEAVEAEIHELRAKITRLGNVNLDAITELEELEQREAFLDGQLTDIRDSQRRLTDLIEKLNQQCETMFRETFEAIRGHFQAIFRKLFAGGRADILLADPDDVLESGIEIIARPPGKELRNISLLSGGEKTMTTVALLFSIFRAKPSPFCILDEVDAALDESNTDRFNVIVREFLDQSQFILITHAKRTMSIADVLYGVTMAEPGVSKRVSVKFAEAAEMAEDEAVTA